MSLLLLSLHLLPLHLISWRIPLAHLLVAPPLDATSTRRTSPRCKRFLSQSSIFSLRSPPLVASTFSCSRCVRLLSQSSTRCVYPPLAHALYCVLRVSSRCVLLLSYTSPHCVLLSLRLPLARLFSLRSLAFRCDLFSHAISYSCVLLLRPPHSTYDEWGTLSHDCLWQ